MRGAAATAVRGVDGREPPLFVLPNGAGLGYGLFVLDDASRALSARARRGRLPDPLTRGSAWVTLWDNMLEARDRAGGAASTPRCARCRARPTSRTSQRILGYAARAYWRFLSPDQRRARAAALEAVLRAGLARAPHAEPEGGVVQRLSRHVVVADGRGVAGAGVAARGARARAHAGRAGRDRDGAGAGRARGAAAGSEILDAQLERTAEPGSQGAVRVRDAGAVGRSGRA